MLLAPEWQHLRAMIEAFTGELSLAYENFSDATQLHINAAHPMRAASLIKVPILLAALQDVDKGRFDLKHRYTFHANDVVGGSGVLQALSPGLRLSLKDILTLMIIVSDNSATNMAIEILGLESINRFHDTAGLEQTQLIGKLQLPESQHNAAQRAGKRNFTSALDMLKLLKALYQGTLLSKDSQQLAISILEQQLYTEAIGRYLPLNGQAQDSVRLASKSGALAGLWHDMALIYGAKDYALVIMTDGSEDTREHWEQEGMMLIAQLSHEIYQKTLKTPRRNQASEGSRQHQVSP